MTETLYVNGESDVRLSYINYVTDKKISSVGERANLNLRTTGSIGVRTISIPEEQARAQLRRQMINSTNIVDNFERNQSPVWTQVLNPKDFHGPYKKQISSELQKKYPNLKVQRIVAYGESIYFGIINDKIVAYRLCADKAGNKYMPYESRFINRLDNNDAYLENVARQHLLKILKYEEHRLTLSEEKKRQEYRTTTNVRPFRMPELRSSVKKASGFY